MIGPTNLVRIDLGSPTKSIMAIYLIEEWY